MSPDLSKGTLIVACNDKAHSPIGMGIDKILLAVVLLVSAYLSDSLTITTQFLLIFSVGTSRPT